MSELDDLMMEYHSSKTYPCGHLDWNMDNDFWEAYVQPAAGAPDIFLGTHKTLEGARNLVYDWVLEQEGGKS
jgi:hypothetical protein